MDFLKILLSTLIIALITALVFFALYFLFPRVAVAQFGVSVDYAPERTYIPPGEKTKVDEIVEAVTETVEEVIEPVAEPEPEPEPEPVVKKEPPVIEEAPKAELSEDGEVVKDFLNSAKVKVVLPFIEGYASEYGVDLEKVKNEELWSESDIEQINKIGGYIAENGIDLDEEFRFGNITKMLNEKKMSESLEGLVEFIVKEVRF